MKIFRYGLICGLLALVLAGGWRNWRQRQRIQALQGDLPPPGAHAANLRKLSELRTRIRELQAKDRVNSAGSANVTPRATEDWVDRLGKPEVQRLLQVQFEGKMETTYGQLFRGLQNLPGMTPARLGQLKELLLQEQAAVLQSILATQGKPPQAMAEQVATEIASSDREIHAALGNDAYAQYQQYTDTLPQRAAVALVSQNLDYGAARLTDDQTERLISLLAANPAAGGALNVQSDVTPIPNIFNPEPAGVSKAALDAAPGILLPDQLAALEAVRQQQQIHLQLLNWIGRAEQAPENH